MARGVNKAIIVGFLGQDPEIRYMANGNAVANLSIATTESWKDKNTGEKQEKTEWHRISMFGRLAEIAGEYLSKGSQVYIEGRLQTDKYEKNGVDHYSTKIIASQLQMLGGKGQQQGSGSYQGSGGQSQGGQQAAPQSENLDFDDDIPF